MGARSKPRHRLTELEQQKGRENRHGRWFSAWQAKGRKASARIRKARGDVYFYPEEAARGRTQGGETVRKRHEAARLKRGQATCANASCGKQFWPKRLRKGQPPKTCSHECAGALRGRTM